MFFLNLMNIIYSGEFSKQLKKYKYGIFKEFKEFAVKGMW
jgi:hypothetical protein